MAASRKNLLEKSHATIFKMIEGKKLGQMTFMSAFINEFPITDNPNHYISLLKYLNDRNIFTQVIKTAVKTVLAKIADSDPDRYNKLNLAINYWDERKLDSELPVTIQNEIKYLMGQFTNGFGQITYEGALLACAQTQEQKRYLFDPTVLKGDDDGKGNAEFHEYLQEIKSLGAPFNNKFLIAESHWLSGEINIDKDGTVSIVLLDSLGKDSPAFPKHIIQSIAEIFPGAKIYYSEEKRQHASSGCSVVALEDTFHLFTLSKYLDPKYNDGGIFAYLAAPENQKNVINDVTDNLGKPIEIIACQLPLTLDRVKQKKYGLFNEIIPSRDKKEQDLIINKKGETALQSAQRYFRPDINMRLSDKLGNLAVKNGEYVLKNQSKWSEVKDRMAQFTLDGFKKRIYDNKNTAQYKP